MITTSSIAMEGTSATIILRNEFMKAESTPSMMKRAENSFLSIIFTSFIFILGRVTHKSNPHSGMGSHGWRQRPHGFFIFESHRGNLMAFLFFEAGGN